MIKINLVPQEILAKEAQRQQYVQAGIICGILVVIMTVMTTGHLLRAQHLETHLNERQAEFDKLKKIVDQVEEEEQKAHALQARLGVITDLLKGRALYPYFMLDLAATMPSDVWVNSVTTLPGPAGGNQLSVTLVSNSASSESISTWMRTLQSSTAFSEPTIGAISTSGASPMAVNTFTLTTTYKSPKL